MKAKEYFEKYFADLESTDAVPNNEKFTERACTFFAEMSNELIDICDARGSRSDSALEGALKEQNQKFNAVGHMIEKKFGHPFLIRNSFLDFWKERLDGTK